MEYAYTMVLTAAMVVVVITTEVANPERVTVGIIVNSDGIDPEQRESDANVTETFGIIWKYVDYREMYYIFKAVRQFDLDNAVDVIVFTDYTPTLWSNDAVLEPENKRMIRLPKSTTNETPESLLNIAKQYSNDSWVPTVNPDSEPACRESTNASSISSSPMLMSATSHSDLPMILARLVRLQKWQTLHIFYDTSKERELQVLVDTLSSNGIAFSLYNVDVITNLHDVLLNAYDVAVIAKPEIYFVVLCKLKNMLKVFHAANRFDNLNRRHQTLMTLFSRWLAIFYNYTSSVAELLNKVASGLGNVAIVAVPEIQSIPPLIIKSYLRMVATDGADSETKQGLLEAIETSLTTMDPVSACDGYIVKTLMWTESGRDLSDVGHASLDTRLHLQSEVFPNLKYGYSRRHFRVVTMAYPPFVIERNNNGTREFVGVCIDLLQELAKVLNFTYTLEKPADGKWGTPDGVQNGTYIYNGIIGMLQRHEADISAAPLAQTIARETVSDFSYQIYLEYTTVILRKPDPNMYKKGTLYYPFKSSVHLLIGAALIAVTVVVWVMEKYNAFYTDPSNAATRKEKGGLHTAINSFWYTYGALIYQGGVNLPDSFAGRTLISIWWLFCMVIAGIYCGNLIAFLTVSKDAMPFNSLEEMAETKGEYKWGTLGSASWEHIFTTSNKPDFKKIGDAMLEFNKTDPDTFHTATSHHIEKVKKGGYAYIADLTMIEVITSTACDLVRIKELFLPAKYAFTFQSGSPHTAIFNEQIMKIGEAGMFPLWRRKWWPTTNICSDDGHLKATPISLSDVQSAYYLCALGFVIGTVAFIAEVVIFKCRRKNRDDPNVTESEPEVRILPTRPVTSDEEITTTEL